jgi:hypothetical protein
LGVKIDEAPWESLATNARGAVVTSCRFQRKMYTPSPVSSKAEFGSGSPRIDSVKSSPVSSTTRVCTDSCPTVTLKIAPADILGGKLAEKDTKYTAAGINDYLVTH